MKTKHDYTALDAAILAALKGGKPVLFTALLAGAPRDEAEKLGTEARGHTAKRGDEKPAWRFIDTRLQALRKAGKIKYQRKSKTEAEGWVLGESPKRAKGA